MLAVTATGFLAIAGLAFDVTTLLAMLDPGRERVRVSAIDGTFVHYSCRPGPAGEMPHEQAAKAQLAFEANEEKFVQAAADGLLAEIDSGDGSLAIWLTLVLKADAWMGAIELHLEQEYGCTLLN
jgi:hypothetical protein